MQLVFRPFTLRRVVNPVRQRRPTREETRARLLDAAATVFVERGIGAASVDDIAAAAGFSRGALYSNFADKDELVLALLEHLTDLSTQEIDDLIQANPKPDDYLSETQRLLFDEHRPLQRHNPVLGIELTLYAMRNPAARPLLKERLDRAHSAVLRAIEHNAQALGLHPANNRSDVAAMINAMDDGFSLHALIDPSRDPLRAFSVALDFLGEAGAAIAYVEAHKGPKRMPTTPAKSPANSPGAKTTAKTTGRSGARRPLL
jgi:AcrR family transcriptional regulator